LTINAAITRYASCVIETRGVGDKKVRLVSLDTKREEGFAFVRRDGEGEALQVAAARGNCEIFPAEGGFTLTTDSEAPAGRGNRRLERDGRSDLRGSDRFTPLERAKSIGFTSAATGRNRD